MTDREAMKLALFALDIVKIHYTQSRHINEAIAALKERLAQPEQTEVQQLIALVRAQQITIDKLEMALADPMREVQRLGQEIEQEPPQRTWIGLEGAEFGWFCHTDFLNARKYTKKQREHICNQLMSEAQSWDIEQYTLMMHDSTKLKEKNQ